MKARQFLRLILILIATAAGTARAQSPPFVVIPTPLPDVTSAGGTSYEFTIQYADDFQISTATIDDNDVRVSGPRGFDAPAVLVSLTPDTRPFANAPVTTTYRITPPGGSWDADDVGTYALIMQPNQVRDRLGLPVDAGELARFTVTLPGAGPAAQPLNISTRVRVDVGQNVMIGGFIVTGQAPKRVVLRALGPTLGNFGLAGFLADPTVSLHGPGGPIVSNNDWKESQQAEIEGTTLAPSDPREAAIVATLPPGGYTAIVEGNGQTTGVGLVEVYDLDPNADAKLGNISTRGMVEAGDNIMIAGFILGQGSGASRVIVRAVGPSLSGFGVTGALADPALQVRDSNGVLVRSNNDWKESQQAEIQATSLAPQNDSESAIVARLPPGAYTALVTGNGGTTGVALVEVYHLP